MLLSIEESIFHEKKASNGGGKNLTSQMPSKVAAIQAPEKGLGCYDKLWLLVYYYDQSCFAFLASSAGTLQDSLISHRLSYFIIIEAHFITFISRIPLLIHFFRISFCFCAWGKKNIVCSTIIDFIYISNPGTFVKTKINALQNKILRFLISRTHWPTNRQGIFPPPQPNHL